MSGFALNQIQSILAKEGISIGEKPEFATRPIRTSKTATLLLAESFQRLGGSSEAALSKIEVANNFVMVNGSALIVHDELAFNRYTAICLRSEFYQGALGFKLESFVRYCRQFEENCKKAGLKPGIWTNRLAEELFGQSADPGDFYDSGSSGWRLNAIQGMLRDIVLLQQGIPSIHVAIYDGIMIEGKLHTVADLLKTPGTERTKVVARYLKRRLGLDNPAVPTAE